MLPEGPPILLSLPGNKAFENKVQICFIKYIILLIKVLISSNHNIKWIDGWMTVGKEVAR